MMSEGPQVCPGKCIPRKTTKDRLFTKSGERDDDDRTSKTDQKVSVIGTGMVGIGCVVALLFQKITKEIVLVDANEKLVTGEKMDLDHGSPILDFHVEACTDYKNIIGSKVVVITAGARQQEGETRLDLLDKNVNIFKSIIPNIVTYCPDAIILIITNPCDVLTYVAWKLSGFPRHRVIGSGTLLDSLRFRYLISKRLCISPKMVDAWIIGEHGDSSVALWSGVSVGNVRLRDIEPKFGRDDDPENWLQIHQDVIKAAGKVHELKGYTNWAIGLSCAHIVDSILHDKNCIVPVSTFAKGILKIEDDVTLALPCVLGSRGVVTVLKNALSKDEHEKLKTSAELLYKFIDKIQF